MALNPRIKSIFLISSGLIVFLVSAITYAIFNHKTHYQYGVLIDSGNPNVTISLYRWPIDRLNNTGLAELAETCLGGDLTNYLDNSDNISQVFQPCLSRVIGSFDDSASLSSSQSSSSTASPLFFTVSGSLRLVNSTYPEKVKSLVGSIVSYLTNQTKLDVRSASVIDESHSAIFPWIAVHASAHHDVKRIVTSGVIEMSSFSSSVSYELPENSSVTPNPASLVTVNLYGHNHSLVGASYPCLGSDKARLRHVILLITEQPDSTVLGDACLPANVNQTVNTDDLASDVCLMGNRKLPSGKEYLLVGKGDGKTCSSLISSILLDPAKCKANFATCFDGKPLELPENVVYTAISDFLYPLSALQLTGDVISESDYLNQTESLCSLSRDELLASSESKLAPQSICFQLVYNYWTIRNTFGITGNWSNIRFQTGLRGDSSLNWQTGFMVNATNSVPLVEAPKIWFDWISFLFITLIAVLLIVVGVYFLTISLRTQRVPDKEIYQPIQQQPQP